MRIILVLAASLAASSVGPLARAIAANEPTMLAQAGDLSLHQTRPAQPHTDRFGDPLPDGVLARMGCGRLRLGAGCTDLIFSPDGKLLAACSLRALTVWDAVTGKRRYEAPIKARSGARCAFLPDGVRVVAPDYSDKKIRLYDLNKATGAIYRALEVSAQAPFGSYGLSSDARLFAWIRDKDVIIGDARTGREISRVTMPGGRPSNVAFSPGGDSLAVTDVTDSIYVYDLSTGKLKRKYAHAGDRILRVTWSPDGRLLASVPPVDRASVHFTSIWDTRTGKEMHRLQSPMNLVIAVAFSPDNRCLALGSLYPGVVLYDLRTGKEVGRLAQSGYAIPPIVFSPDGRTVATQGDHVIRLWDVATGNALPSWADPFDARVHHMHFSPNGDQLFGSAGRPVAWDVHTGREREGLHRPATPSWHVLLSPDAAAVASIGQDGELTLLDARTGTERYRLDRSRGYETNLAFSADSRRLYAATFGKAIREWDVRTGRQLRTFDTDGRDVSSLTPSPDGQWLAASAPRAGSYRDVSLWDLTNGRLRATLSAQRGSVNGMAISADSRSVAVVGADSGGMGTISICDISAGSVWRELTPDKGRLHAVAFSPDGRMLAAGGQDGNLSLWELSSGRVRQRFVGHQDWISSLAFSPDGLTLAAASSDAPVFIWAVRETRPGKRSLSPAALQKRWKTLASTDAASAWDAVKEMAAAPGDSVSFLQQHLHPAAPVDEKLAKQWLAALDSPRFAVRQRASADLARWLEQAEPLLRKARTTQISTEARRRIDQLLQELDRPTGERLRHLRAVEVLEMIATPEARALLTELARGAPEAGVTRAAKAALQRLPGRRSAKNRSGSISEPRPVGRRGAFVGVRQIGFRDGRGRMASEGREDLSPDV